MWDITAFEFDEKRDLERIPVWFLDGTHSVPPWTPMFAWSWINYCRHGMQWAAQQLSLPTCKGWDWRLKDGGGYLGILVVEDEEEIRAREKKFRERLLPFIEDYDRVWNEAVNEMLAHYDRLKKFDVDHAGNAELLEHFEDALRVNKRMWELHFYLMYVVFGVFIMFEKLCKELLGMDDTDPNFHKLLRGFDNKVFQVDRRLWEFSLRARELGLEKVFLEAQPQDYLARLEASEQGRRFLAEFRAFLDEDGWRAQRMSEFINPTWIEDPTPALVYIRQFLVKGGDFNLDRERERLAEERKRMEEEVLARVPADKREWFATVMRLAQKSSSFSEEHNHYFDLYTHALVRRALVAWGKRLSACGTIEKPEDVFFLIPDEIRMVGLAPEYHNLKPTVERRRKEWERWCQKDNPPMIGNVGMEKAMEIMLKSNDPIVLKVVVGSFPVAKPEIKADLYGVSGSPGVAEGIARVVLQESDLIEVKSGEILVAPATYPSWTPIFALVRGVVVDRGASLSHAAIVGREYGIPVVMNVFEGTKVIKTGQRIRVDGDLGTVTILDK